VGKERCQGYAQQQEGRGRGVRPVPGAVRAGGGRWRTPALQHLAVDGRTAPELQAKSRHAHLASLGRYVQLGEQTSAQVTANADPAARRKPR